jgi:hypothetical protein
LGGLANGSYLAFRPGNCRSVTDPIVADERDGGGWLKMGRLRTGSLPAAKTNIRPLAGCFLHPTSAIQRCCRITFSGGSAGALLSKEIGIE